MKFSSGNAAERHAFQSVLRRKRQTRPIAVRQLPAVCFRQMAAHNRSNRVEHIAARQIIRRRDFRLPRRLRMALRFHHLLAVQPKLHTRKRMNAVVNAPMIRHVTAGHPAVRRIHNRIAPERGDIALPEIQPRLHRRKVVDIRHALFCRLLLQIRILNVQKFCTALFHHAHIHQPPQKLSLPGAVRRNLHSAVLPALFQQ